MNAILRNWKWLAATLAIAAAVHVASVFAVPRLIMWRAMTGIARNAGGVNRMGHGARPTATSRGVVRPSPDLLYSSCVFDLSHGPVRVHVAGMPNSYWSVSLFDEETNNFYVVNDRQAKTGAFDLVIVAPDWDKPVSEALVRAPTRHGLVLIRTLIDDEAHLRAIDAARRNAACGPAYAGHS